jgi:hypothetical protein
LRAARQCGFVIGDGSRQNRNILNPDGSWKKPISPPLEKLLDRNELEYIATSRAANRGVAGGEPTSTQWDCR